MLDDDALERYRSIYRRIFGESIDREEALLSAENFLELIRSIVQILHRARTE